MKRLLAFLIPIACVMTVAACGFEHQSNIVAPSQSGGSQSSQNNTVSMIGIWSSQTVSLPSARSCSNFQWTVMDQTSRSMAGSFSATCEGGATITGSASGQLVNNSTVSLTATGTGSMPGIPSCSFSLASTSATISGNNAVLMIPYSGTTCLGPVHGTETIRKHTDPPPPPPPPPSPPPPPPPPPPPSPAPAPGGFSLANVQIVGGSPDVRNWAVTSQFTNLSFGGGVIHVDHTKRGQWPPVDIGGALQEATIWIFENINGQWYGTGGERLRPGQTDKGLGSPSAIGTGWFYSSYWAPLTGYVPRPGEIVGFMIAAGSTRADNNAPVHERTNVVLIQFPDDNGGSFPPFAWQE